MATATEEIVLTSPGQLVGPGSVFEQKRISLQREVALLLVESKAITVNSVESAEKATAAGRVLLVAKKERESFYKNIKSQIDNLKRPILEAEKQDIGELESEGTRLGQELTKFNNAERAKREEIERQARAAAEAAEREAILNRAIELEAAGETEQAEAIMDEPVFVPVVIQATAPPKVAGQVQKFTYGMEVTDLMALVKSVAAGTVPLQAVQANESYLGSKARLEKEAYSVPGTRLIKKESVHFRS